MPKAVFISTSFPPLIDSQTIRNIYLIAGLQRRGFDVEVVAPSGEGDLSLLDSLGDRIRILRTAPSAYDVAFGYLKRVNGRAGAFMRSAFAVAAGRVLAPDVRRDWTRTAVAAARAGVRSVPDLIVSSAGSFTAHLAAAELSSHWGRPWLADYGDPWSFNPIAPASTALIRWQNRRLESNAIRHCAALSVTTEPTAAVYREWLGPDRRIEVVPCGFSPRPDGVPSSRRESADLVIAYVGSASHGTRDMRPFLRALASVARPGDRRVKLEIVGATSPRFASEAQRLGLDVRFTGWVSYEESLRHMHAADVLLLIGNATPLQIPGKVFNYGSTAAPILYLRQLARAADPTWQLIGRWPGVVEFEAADENMGSALASALARLPQLVGEARARAASPDIADYAWDRVGDTFGELASSLLQRAPLAPV